MSQTWYMTVGVPGGEYAIWAGCNHDAVEVVRLHPVVSRWFHIDVEYDVPIRPCPPDIVGWIENRAPANHIKVTGGWLFLDRDRDLPHGFVQGSAVFIPVAHTENLTVLETPSE